MRRIRTSRKGVYVMKTEKTGGRLNTPQPSPRNFKSGKLNNTPRNDFPNSPRNGGLLPPGGQNSSCQNSPRNGGGYANSPRNGGYGADQSGYANSPELGLGRLEYPVQEQLERQTSSMKMRAWVSKHLPAPPGKPPPSHPNALGAVQQSDSGSGRMRMSLWLSKNKKLRDEPVLVGQEIGRTEVMSDRDADSDRHGKPQKRGSAVNAAIRSALYEVYDRHTVSGSKGVRLDDSEMQAIPSVHVASTPPPGAPPPPPPGGKLTARERALTPAEYAYGHEMSRGDQLQSTVI